MKNTHIKNLRQEIPADIRLQVYKELLESERYEYVGLCILLPMTLWGLRDTIDDGPDGEDWDFEDTSIAFPELTKEIISLITAKDRKRGEKREKYLQQWIKKLES